MRSLSLDSLSVVDEDDFERPSRPSLSPSLSLTSLPSPAPVQRVVDLTTQVWTQANSKSLPITAGFFVKYTRVNNITNRATSSVVCQTCQSRLHSDSKDTWIKHLKSAHNKNDTDTYARYITAEQTSRAVSGLSQPSTASFTASSPPITPTQHSSLQRSIFDDAGDMHSHASGGSSTLPSMFRAQNERHGESLAGATGRLFGIASIPHSLVNNSEWWNFLQFVRSLPANEFSETRGVAVKYGQSVIANRMTEEIYRRLNGKNVTVAIDGWTDVNSVKVHNVLVLYGGAAYYLHGIFIPNKKNTAIEIHKHLKPIIEKLISKGLRVVAFATDNAAVMTKTFNLLKTDFLWLIHVKCAAHTLQLIVRAMLNTDIGQKILKELYVTIQAYEKSSQMRADLHNLQSKNPKTLRRSCPTRWSSDLLAISRFIDLKEFVLKSIVGTKRASSHPDDWWVALNSLKNLLKEFQIVTDQVQSDSATLYTASQGFFKLYDFLSDFKKKKEEESMHSVAQAGLNKMTGRWFAFKHKSNSIKMCSLIVQRIAVKCFPNLSNQYKTECYTGKEVQDVLAWFYNWGAQYFTKWHNPSATIQSIETLISVHYGNWCSADNGFELFADKVVTLKSCEQDMFLDAAIFQAFKSYLDSHPAFVEATLALMSIVPSEAAVERSFSAQSLIQTNRRNRLSPSTVIQEMIIKFNSKTLTRPPVPQTMRFGKKPAIDTVMSTTSNFDELEMTEEDVDVIDVRDLQSINHTSDDDSEGDDLAPVVSSSENNAPQRAIISAENNSVLPNIVVPDNTSAVLQQSSVPAPLSAQSQLPQVKKRANASHVKPAPKKQKAQHECQCGEGENGQKWIGCDGADCAIGWYHLSCVGLKRAPKGMWLCSDCNDEKDTDESDVD